MIKELIKLADYLDGRGMHKKADHLDTLIKRAAEASARLGPSASASASESKRWGRVADQTIQAGEDGNYLIWYEGTYATIQMPNGSVVNKGWAQTEHQDNGRSDVVKGVVRDAVSMHQQSGNWPDAGWKLPGMSKEVNKDE